MAEHFDDERLKLDVSIIIANYNGDKFLADAIRSALSQTLQNLEVIVSDDASTDSSAEIIKQMMAADDRVRLVRSGRNGGPAVARNTALDVARGRWICILDSDDVMHPDRIRALIEEGEESDADVVADNLLLFDTDRRASPQTLLSGRWSDRKRWISAAGYVASNNFYGSGPALGYLKPIFRASTIERNGIRYDERLRIAEDYNFVFRLLMAGATFRLIPSVGYFYRKHSQSISHRLNAEVLQSILDAESDYEQKWPLPALRRLFRARARSVKRAIAFDRLVQAIKSKQVGRSLAVAIANPGAAVLLRLPMAQFFSRLRPKAASPLNTRRQICVLSRQRVTGRNNGSSRYLLDILAFLAERDTDVHLVVPSPSTLGRWPFLKLSSDMKFFKSIRMRGTVRIGNYVVAVDPQIAIKGLLGVLDRLLYRKGLTARPLSKPAPYAIAQALTREDLIFIAREAPPIADVLIADYCFLTDAYPYALRPDAKRIVIMHDLFSSRSDSFAGVGAKDSVASLSLADETKMLAAADTIVAIQGDEAAILQRQLPDHDIVVAPIAAYPVDSAQVGCDNIVLFVGSSAAPNVDGLKWFVEFCWPSIRDRRPEAVLLVAGSVCGSLGKVPDAVKLLNVVDSLEKLYAQAAVVISPLRAGSGLKIKLIEALSKGKAVVATSTTLQGVFDILAGCVRIADTAPEFASMVVDLLENGQNRAELGTLGIMAVSEHFASDRAYGAVAAATEEPKRFRLAGCH